MDENQMKQAVVSYLLSHGKVDPTTHAAAITEYANSCPAGVVDANATELEKAYKFIMISENKDGNQDGKKEEGKLTVSEDQLKPLANISVEEKEAIANRLEAANEDLRKASTTSEVTKLILDRMAPKDLIKKGATGLITDKSYDSFLKKITDGEFVVCEDDGDSIDADKRIASKTNWAALQAAHKDKKPVAIHIGELSTRAIGYLAKVDGAKKEEQMTREELDQYVTLKTEGYILASEKTPGVLLRFIKPKEDTKNPGKVIPGKTVLSDANKKAAIEAGSFVISREISKGNETEEVTLKTALQIRVKVFKDGKPVYQRDGKTQKTETRRLSVKYTVPKTVRSSIYIEKFGNGEPADNTLQEVPSAENLKKIQIAQTNNIANLNRIAQDPLLRGGLKGVIDSLKDFQPVATEAKAGSTF